MRKGLFSPLWILFAGVMGLELETHVRKDKTQHRCCRYLTYLLKVLCLLNRILFIIPFTSLPCEARFLFLRQIRISGLGVLREL